MGSDNKVAAGQLHKDEEGLEPSARPVKMQQSKDKRSCQELSCRSTTHTSVLEITTQPIQLEDRHPKPKRPIQLVIPSGREEVKKERRISFEFGANYSLGSLSETTNQVEMMTKIRECSSKQNGAKTEQHKTKAEPTPSSESKRGRKVSSAVLSSPSNGSVDEAELCRQRQQTDWLSGSNSDMTNRSKPNNR